VGQFSKLRHAWGVDNVSVENFVDEFAQRLDVEHIHIRENVISQQGFDTSLLENLLNRFADGGIARVQHRHRQFERSNFFGVAQDDVFFAKIHATGQQDDVGINLADFVQVVLAQPASGHHFDDAARPKRRFARRPGRHAVSETMHGHAQTARRRTVDKSLRLADGLAETCLQVSDGFVHANAHVTLCDAGLRKTLGEMLKSAFRQTPKAVDFGDGGTDLDGQDFDCGGQSKNLLVHGFDGFHGRTRIFLSFIREIVLVR
jgi:hypothetical protein